MRIMSTINRFYPDSLIAYLRRVGVRESAPLQLIRESTSPHQHAHMMITPEQGEFLAWIVKACNAKNILEIGTFTGYSAGAMAQALTSDGRLTCLEINEDSAATAQKNWANAGLSEQIELRLGPALDSLDNMINNEQVDRFDCAFIDADKQNYQNYYERLLLLLKPGGVMIFDNVFLKGRVWDDSQQQKSTQAMREFNQFCHRDDRVDISMIPLSDGVLLIRKR